jgi:hypothetical protein
MRHQAETPTSQGQLKHRELIGRIALEVSFCVSLRHAGGAGRSDYPLDLDAVERTLNAGRK